MENKEAEYLSIPELAKLLGISRIAVFQKVKKGQIKAVKIGRNYAIAKKYLDQITGNDPGSEEKATIEKAVKKTVREYGDVLKRLGKE